MINGVANYPQTPSRIQLSIWPAGIPGEPQGTVDWSGGMIDWSNSDYQSAGHFYAIVQEVDVKCATVDAVQNDTTSYTYGANATTDEPAIELSNASLSGAVSVLKGAKVSIGGMLALAGAMALGALVL
jgi:beta-glucanase (GH16 family)